MSNKDNIPNIGDFQSEEWEKKVREHNKEKQSEGNSTEEVKQDLKKKDPPRIEDVVGSGKKEDSKAAIPNLEDVKKGKESFKGVRSKHIDSCEKLKEKDTTFVFVYGASQSGKSCFLVSLLNHMAKDTEARLEPRDVQENKDAHLLLEEMIEKIEEGRLPVVTDLRTVYELGFSFTPSQPKIPAKFTFLEMSGEHHEQIHLSKKSLGKLPEKVDFYLNCQDINICFVMVIPCDAGDKDEKSWSKIDGNALSFLRYIKEKSPKFDQSNLLCLISKWDMYEGEYSDSPLDFLKENMGRTFAQLNAKGSLIGSYSVGEVIKVRDTDNKIIDFIQPGTMDTKSPEKVKYWLYEAVTGRPISGEPWWKNLFSGI